MHPEAKKSPTPCPSCGHDTLSSMARIDSWPVLGWGPLVGPCLVSLPLGIAAFLLDAWWLGAIAVASALWYLVAPRALGVRYWGGITCKTCAYTDMYR